MSTEPTDTPTDEAGASGERFWRSAFTMLSGSTLAAVLAFAIQPILTRLYTPEAFGLADVFVSLALVLAPLASLRYEDAVMLPEDERESAQVLWLSTFLTLLFTALLAALLPWRGLVGMIRGYETVVPYLIWLPLAVLAVRVNRLGEVWLARLKQFRTLSAGHIARSLTTSGARLGAGLPPLSLGALGLIGGYVVGQLVVGLGYTVASIRKHGAMLREGLRLRGDAGRLLQRYRRFPLFGLPASLFKTLTSRLPFLLLAFYFSESVVGLFGRAFFMLAVPLTLVGGAVAKVFFVHAAEAHRSGTLAPLVERVHERLLLLGFYPTLALVVAGPDLFEVVFGEAWREAGLYLRYVGPWFFLMTLASPLTSLFDVLERQRADLAVSVILFVALVVALVVGGQTGRVTLTLALVGSAGALTRLGHIALMFYLARVPAQRALTPYLRATLFALPGLALLAVAFVYDSPWLVTMAAVLGGAIYVVLAFRSER